MYQASKKFGDAIAGSNRKFNTRLLENEKVLVESVKNFTITSGAEEITIGSAVASYAQATIENKGIALSGKEVSLEIGVEVDGEMEYIPMGLYTIQNPKIESNKVTFTAYDRLASRCNGAYYSKLGYPVDAVDILAEISTMTGVAIDTSTVQRGIQINQRAIIEEGDYNEETEESEVITTYVNPFDGYTYKETIGFIAGLFGKFAICGRTGMIEFRWYQGIDYEIPSNIFYNDLQETEESFSIKRLMCDNSDQTLSSGSGATGISMQNPVMTQGILDGVYNTVQGLVFTPAALRFIGDMRLDIGDIVTAVKNDSTKFTIPIISLITSYDGGLMQTIASYGNTAEEDDSDTKGPITEMAERVEYELAFVKKLMVDNLTATNATIKNLSGDVLKFKTGEFENLKSDVASFKETTTTNLNAANAKIENLEANTVKTSELEAKVGTFGYLKATDASLTYATITNLKAESGKIDDLQSDYATFKTATANDLKAANANIQNLTATKATITDLNAATAKISILEGNYANLNTLVNGNLTSANIQSLTLNSKNTTIENGMIKNAMIENLAFDKITGMDINTTNLTVHSSDGKSKWSDNTIQISDANRVRVQIGKDASNDYSMSVWDKDGKLIWDALGATENTIQRKIIRDNVVADNANISGSKLDINSVVREVNGSTTKLKSSVINMNDKNQTLDVVFNELATTVDEIEVGGRNLLLYSKEPKKHTDFYGVGWFTSEEGTYNGCSTMTTTSRWGRLTILFKKHIIDRELAKVGDVFTYSIYARTNNTSGKQINCSYRVINKVNAGWFKDKTDAITTEWKQVYVTFTITEDMLADNSYLNQIGFEVTSEMTSGDKVYFACPKLEKGNKATDWTPAPEDTQSQIDNITEITTSHTTSISMMQGQISSLISEDTTIKGNYDALLSRYNATVNTVDSMKTTIGEHTTILNSQNDSIVAVTTKANTIESNLAGTTQTVSEVKSNLAGTQERVTKVETSLTGLTTRVSSTETNLANLEIGGRNLVLRSKDFTSGDDYWYINGNYRKSIDDDGFTVVSISRSGAGLEWNRIIPHAFIPVEEMHRGIIVSFDFMCDKVSELDRGCICALQTYNSGGGRIGWYESQDILSGTQCKLSAPLSDGKWIRVQVPFSEGDLKKTYGSSNAVAYTSVSLQLVSNGSIHFKKVKIEYGSKATDYTEAPEDVDQQITAVETIASQTADKFSWLVKSGTNSTDFELTDKTATLVASAINMNGLVTFNGLSTDAKNGILNSFEVGGRNLALNTSNSYSTAFTSFSGVENTCFGLGQVTCKGIAIGDVVTVHLYIKYTDIVPASGQTARIWIQGSGNITAWGNGEFGPSEHKSISGSGEFEFLYSFTMSSAMYINTYWNCALRTDYIASGSIQYKAFKVEKGNKVTDWTPAPEDYLPQANLVSNWTTNSTWIDGGKIYTGSITADKIATDAIRSKNYVANSTGSFLNLKDGTFDSKYLKWDASGNITAKGGTIGKYKITDQWLVTGSGSTCTGIGGNQAFWAGAESSDSAPFRVGYDGKLVSSNADISGKIGATRGTIGKYEITDTYLKTGSGSTCSGIGSDDCAFWAGGTNSKDSNFIVLYDGSVFANNLMCNDRNSNDALAIMNGTLYIQSDNNSSFLSSTGFEFKWGGDCRILSMGDGVKCYRNLYATDFIADGWIYNASGGHYTWKDRADAYISCGNYNNTNNIYYYAGYHAFYVNGDSGSGMMYIETSGVSSRKGFRNSSDERIKKDFKHFDDDFINSYMQLEPVKYRFKDDSDDKYHIGFKAQNVDKTLNAYGKKYDEQFGTCVASHINQDYAEKAYGIKDMNEVYTLAYDELIGANTFMIQKTRKDLLYQAGKIDIHEAIINDLQFKIAKMEKKIEQLTKALA